MMKHNYMENKKDWNTDDKKGNHVNETRSEGKAMKMHSISKELKMNDTAMIKTIKWRWH